jgi:hypothetical protein
MEQQLAVLVTVVGSAILMAVFVAVARSAGTPEGADAVSAATSPVEEPRLLGPGGRVHPAHCLVADAPPVFVRQ